MIFATGIRMGESPRWHDGRFWMCDWLAGEVLVFDSNGDREVVTRVEGLPFSIDWLTDGQLVVSTPNGVVTGTDLIPYGATGQPFNEIVVDNAGRVWVNNYHAYPAHSAFGGYKDSGIGRETHLMVLEHYQQTKNMLVSYSENKLGFF